MVGGPARVCDSAYKEVVERADQGRAQQLARLRDRLRKADSADADLTDQDLRAKVTEEDLATELDNKLLSVQYRIMLSRPPFRPGLTILAFDDDDKYPFEVIYEPEDDLIQPDANVESFVDDMIKSRFPSFDVMQYSIYKNGSWKSHRVVGTYDPSVICLVAVSRVGICCLFSPDDEPEIVDDQWRIGVAARRKRNALTRVSRGLKPMDTVPFQTLITVPVTLRVEQLEIALQVELHATADLLELAHQSLSRVTKDCDRWMLSAVSLTDQKRRLSNSCHVIAGMSYTVECHHLLGRKPLKAIYHVNGVEQVRICVEPSRDKLKEGESFAVDEVVRHTIYGEKWDLNTLKHVGPDVYEYQVDEFGPLGDSATVYHFADQAHHMYTVISPEPLTAKAELAAFLNQRSGLSVGANDIEGELAARGRFQPVFTIRPPEKEKSARRAKYTITRVQFKSVSPPRYLTH